MRTILQKRELRYVFTANMISMLGSGMNAAAVTWFIFEYLMTMGFPKGFVGI